MPILSGPDGYSQVCAIRPDLLVIFTTGYTAELAALNHEIEEGAVCLQKPYSPQTLASSHSEYTRQRPDDIAFERDSRDFVVM